MRRKCMPLREFDWSIWLATGIHNDNELVKKKCVNARARTSKESKAKRLYY